MKTSGIVVLIFVALSCGPYAQGGEDFKLINLEISLARMRVEASLAHYKSLVARELDAYAEVELAEHDEDKEGAKRKLERLKGLIQKTELKITKWVDGFERYGPEHRETRVVESKLRAIHQQLNELSK